MTKGNIPLTIGVILGLAVIIGFVYFTGYFRLPALENGGETTFTEPVLTEPTGNIDDVVTAILQENELDEPLPEETDPTLIDTDDQLINDFDQNFDQGQF